MKVLTREYLVQYRESVKSDETIMPIRCKEHPWAPVCAHYDYDRNTITLSCWQCEKPLIEQPVPHEKDLRV